MLLLSKLLSSTLSHILSSTTEFPFRRCFTIEVVIRGFLTGLLFKAGGAAGGAGDGVWAIFTGIGESAKGDEESQRLGRGGVRAR